MKKCRKCLAEKVLIEFYVNKTLRDGRSNTCKECAKSIRRAWAKAHPKKNAAQCYAGNRRWAAANPERHLASIRKWQKDHPERLNEINARRYAMKRRAVPAWANTFLISEAYRVALLRTAETGYKWHVDHIVPLQSPLVCGLHVEHNLNVIPASENLKKHNCYWPNMP